MTDAPLTVAVLGAGQMGSGIAHVCALAGCTTYIYDTQAAALAKAQADISANLQRQVKKNTISKETQQAAQDNIIAKAAAGDWLLQADFVIEAVNEDMAIKQTLYKTLAPHIADAAVMASNTSSYSISTLAAAAPSAARFIGMHFMNPVPVMPLVEVIAGAKTSQETIHRTMQLAKRLGKQTVCAADSPGFLANRILFPMLNEAAFALYENIGSIEDIDRTMVLGMHHPMGPLALADFIGLDTCLAILNVLHDGFGQPKYLPCPLFAQKVAAGCLGRKSGVGFYDYRTGAPVPYDGTRLK